MHNQHIGQIINGFVVLNNEVWINSPDWNECNPLEIFKDNKQALNFAKEYNHILYEYEIDGKELKLEGWETIRVQLGYKSGKYKTHSSFTAKDMHRALMIYNGINIGNGYKKRLVIGILKPKTIAKAAS